MVWNGFCFGPRTRDGQATWGKSEQVSWHLWRVSDQMVWVRTQEPREQRFYCNFSPTAQASGAGMLGYSAAWLSRSLCVAYIPPAASFVDGLVKSVATGRGGPGRKGQEHPGRSISSFAFQQMQFYGYCCSGSCSAIAFLVATFLLLILASLKPVPLHSLTALDAWDACSGLPLSPFSCTHSTKFWLMIECNSRSRSNIWWATAA